ISDTLETDSFYSSIFNRRFKKRDAADFLEYMAKKGGIEWEDTERATAIVYWRKREEWANVIY
ncbi:hypothetical protein B9Z19DRAFT_970701, partial [Tuber borchii]